MRRPAGIVAALLVTLWPIVDPVALCASGSSRRPPRRDAPQPSPSGAPPADDAGTAARDSALAAALSRALGLHRTLAADAVADWGLVDLGGDRRHARLVSYTHSRFGVLALLQTAPRPRILASTRLPQPIVHATAIALKGDGTRQVCVRTAPEGEPRTARRQTVVLALDGREFVSLFKHEDVDEIASNPDTSRERRATTSEVAFEDARPERPGSLLLWVNRYRVPPGQGEDATEEVGREVHRYVYSTGKGLVEVKPRPEDMPEPESDERADDRGDEE